MPGTEFIHESKHDFARRGFCQNRGGILLLRFLIAAPPCENGQPNPRPAKEARTKDRLFMTFQECVGTGTEFILYRSAGG